MTMPIPPIPVSPGRLNDTWIIVGSAPTMPTYIDMLASRFLDDAVYATTNAGIHEFNHLGFSPDWYGIMEVDTPRLFGRYYAPHRESGQTKVFTTEVAWRNFQDRSIDFAPDYIAPIAGWSDQVPFKLGTFVGCGATGGHLVQLAANAGAKHIVLVGMDGYQSTPGDLKPDTFDGRMGPSHGNRHTLQFYAPALQQVVSACPHIKFSLFGKPVFQLVGSNVRILRSYDEAVEYLK